MRYRLLPALAGLLCAASVQAQTPASTAAAERAHADAIVDTLIAADRAARGKGIPGCPDCTPAVKTRNTRLDMPADTDEAETHAWLQQARQFADAYVHRQGADFHPPAKSAAMPCAAASDAMRKLGGLLNLDEQSEKHQDAMRKGYGEGPGGYLSYVRDVRIWPVQAQCANGELQGPLEFWMFGREVRRYEGKLILDSKLVHYRTQMQAGKQSGAHTATVRTATDVIEGLEGNRKVLSRAADMDWISHAQLRPYSAGGDGKSVVLVFGMSAPGPNQPRDQASVSYTVPLDGQHAFQTVYRGTQKSETRQMKNGLRHGLTQLWPFSEPLGPGLPNYIFPGSEICYRKGLVVNLQPCTNDDPEPQIKAESQHLSGFPSGSSSGVL